MDIEIFNEPTQKSKLTIEEEEDQRKGQLMIKLDAFVKLRPFINRYTRLIKLDERFDMNTQWARHHSNRLVLFGITSNHPLVKLDLKISSVFYPIVNNDMEHLSDLVSGKRKSNFFVVKF